MTTKSIHTEIAYRAIKEYLNTGSTKRIESENISGKLKNKAACFVTLKTEDGKLRGCIGTLYPVYNNLYTEIIKNAVASAVRDYRFEPVTADELDTLKISVEVLQKPEKISGPEIKIIKRKAGIFQKSNNGLVFYRFKTKKYY